MADMMKSFSKLSATFSAVKNDFKEDQSEGSSASSASSNSSLVEASLRTRAGIRLVSSRAIQGRTPVSGITHDTAFMPAPRSRRGASSTAGKKYFTAKMSLVQNFKTFLQV